MLDDRNLISQVDSKDILGFSAQQVAQLDWVFDLPSQENRGITNIILGGMGGSAWFTEIIKVWPGYGMPFDQINHYTLPDYANEQTLFVASSFSGNTEETLSLLGQAKERGCHLAILTAGGKLEQIAADENIVIAKMDSNIPQPRMATYSELKGMLAIMHAYGLIETNYSSEMHALRPSLTAAAKSWHPDVITPDNLAKRLAEFMAGKSPVMYSGPMLLPAAKKLKITCNENAKNVAWFNTYPEYNHNEYIGWTGGPVEKPYAIINFLTDLEHPRIKKRFDISDKLLSGRRPEPMNIQCQGSTIIEQILWAMMLGDFAATYLAVLNGINPEPVELVEKLKVELNN